MPLDSITAARAEDAPTICTLLNRAYRGETSRTGWTTEADLIGGEVRTDEAEVRDIMSRDGSIFLVHRDDVGVPDACVNLQDRNGRVYLGMFAVEPARQAGGLGRALLGAAEAWALARGCRSVFMYVISLRTELIEWYARCGYADTGERVPFPEDGRSGNHLRALEFMIMEKGL
ncbi:MAG: GNAT family N-acetyltransferase [Chitinophagia bacterium]|nr:GNAT family N-acetyltransferase [Chitinophagia bacterium]